MSELDNQFKKFKRHWYVNRAQGQFIIESKTTTQIDEIILQIDFAENFAIFNQDEVQAAHFGYDQVTIFTACAWHTSGKTSIGIVSDCLQHDKCSVWVYLKKIISYLKEVYPGIKKLLIFSDGCTSQFKNRYILSSLPLLENVSNMKITWSFFATAHGKGAVDAIGGTIKRAVWLGIKARKVKIDTARDFADYSTKKLTGMKIVFVDKKEIDDNCNIFKQNCENLKQIPKLLTLHHFKVEDNKLIYQTIATT